MRRAEREDQDQQEGDATKDGEASGDVTGWTLPPFAVPGQCDAALFSSVPSLIVGVVPVTANGMLRTAK